MSTNLSAFGFNHPIKSELERLLSIQSDLRRTVSALQMLAPPSPLMRESGSIGMALYTQALVSYFRCFASGRRKGLSQDIFSSKPVFLAIFTDVKSIRDKHVAHPVSEHEHCNILVAASDANSQAVGLGVRYWFFAGGDDKHMKQFLQLAKFTDKHVSSEVRAKGDELSKEILGPRATWRSAQRDFYRAVSEEAVYGPIRNED